MLHYTVTTAAGVARNATIRIDDPMHLVYENWRREEIGDSLLVHRDTRCSPSSPLLLERGTPVAVKGTDVCGIVKAYLPDADVAFVTVDASRGIDRLFRVRDLAYRMGAGEVTIDSDKWPPFEVVDGYLVPRAEEEDALAHASPVAAVRVGARMGSGRAFSIPVEEDSLEDTEDPEDALAHASPVADGAGVPTYARVTIRPPQGLHRFKVCTVTNGCTKPDRHAGICDAMIWGARKRTCIERYDGDAPTAKRRPPRVPSAVATHENAFSEVLRRAFQEHMEARRRTGGVAYFGVAPTVSGNFLVRRMILGKVRYLGVYTRSTVGAYVSIAAKMDPAFFVRSAVTPSDAAKQWVESMVTDEIFASGWIARIEPERFFTA